MKLLKGTTRYCFVFGNIVFKFPSFQNWYSFLNGLVNNILEYRWSKFIYIYNYLCPICFYIPGGFLNIMPYCKPINEKQFKELDIKKYKPAENKIDSFGLYNNKIVVIDYH